MSYINKEKLVDLKTQFVVVKKYNGQTCYYGTHDPSRPDRWAHRHDYRNAKYAIRYTSAEIAQAKCDALNKDRQKLKFKVDKASKHFVSNFSVRYNKDNNCLELYNFPISLQDFKEGKAPKHQQGINNFDEYLPKMLSEIDENNKKFDTYIKNFDNINLTEILKLQDKQEKEMSQLKLQLQESFTDAKTKIDAVKQIKQFIETEVRGTFFESLKTESDNKFQILFGKGGNNGNA
jgi:hypothetical protein